MEELLTGVTAALEGRGPWVYLAGPGLTALVAVLPLPAEAPAMVNGMLFGPVAGTVVTWAGAVAGALVSFELARTYGRPLLGRVLGPGMLDSVDRLSRDASWQAMLVARFIPVVAFTGLNWGAGLTTVSRWRFLWTTALGILPGCIVFTAAGTGAAALLGGALPVVSAMAVALLVYGYFRGRRGSGPPPPM